jgi:hypothetical protein
MLLTHCNKWLFETCKLVCVCVCVCVRMCTQTILAVKYQWHHTNGQVLLVIRDMKKSEKKEITTDTNLICVHHSKQWHKPDLRIPHWSHISLTYAHYSKEWHKPHITHNSKQWHKPHVQTTLNSNTNFTCVYHSEEPHKPHLCKLKWTVTQTSPVHITMATIISR